MDGEQALTIAITKTQEANTVDVSETVRDALPGIEAKIDRDPQFTVVFDQAPYIQQSIDSLAEEGLLGLGFAVVVILVFLLSVRSTLVTAISIPTSVLLAAIGMRAAGYTLNIITLPRLTIAIGRVVDDSIVVIENIKRHLHPGVDRRPGRARRRARGRRRGHRVDPDDRRGVPAGRLRRRARRELFRPFAAHRLPWRSSRRCSSR